MIRPARLGDLDAMQEMGAQFFAASGLDRWFSYDVASFRNSLEAFIENPFAATFVAEDNGGIIGMAAALAYACWFNRDHITAQELFWWVDPSRRGDTHGRELREAMDDWARHRGCRTFEMGALEALRPEVLENYYARLGYGAKERIFCKRIV